MSTEVQPTITMPRVSDLVTGIPLGLIATRAPVRLITTMTSVIWMKCILCINEGLNKGL